MSTAETGPQTPAGAENNGARRTAAGFLVEQQITGDPRQIVGADELEVGMEVVVVCDGEPLPRSRTVTREPYSSGAGVWFGTDDPTGRLSLGDMGIIRQDGGYNPRNVLYRADTPGQAE